MAAVRNLLAGGRWHFQHGPIDLVIGAEGAPEAVAAGHADAWARFVPLLDELVAELPALRAALDHRPCPLRGPVARRMWQACAPHRGAFITPMAAVAGSVAQQIAACYVREGVKRAWVNNGGDIALHLTRGAEVKVGLYADLARFDWAASGRALQGGLDTDGRFAVTHAMPVRGIATSGWRGRSFSRGIADSVTVLARTAAEADACATVIANAVDLDDARIVRQPACDLQDDSDLGSLPVTVDVPALGTEAVRRALDAGMQVARRLQRQGHVWAAVLTCQGEMRLAQNAHEARPALPASQLQAECGVGSVFA